MQEFFGGIILNSYLWSIFLRRHYVQGIIYKLLVPFNFHFKFYVIDKYINDCFSIIHIFNPLLNHFYVY